MRSFEGGLDAIHSNRNQVSGVGTINSVAVITFMSNLAEFFDLMHVCALNRANE